MGHRHNIASINPASPELSVVICVKFAAAAKLDPLLVLGTLDLPAIYRTQPMIRFLQLITILDMLAKHSVFVTDTVPLHRQLQGGATIEKTGGQSAQTTVAQSGILFDIGHFFKIEKDFIQCLGDFIHDPQIEY